MEPATSPHVHIEDRLPESVKVSNIREPLPQGCCTNMSDKEATSIQVSPFEACNAEPSLESASIQMPSVNACEAESSPECVNTHVVPMCRAHPMDTAVVKVEALSLSLHKPAKTEEQLQQFAAELAPGNGDVLGGLLTTRGSCLSSTIHGPDLEKGLCQTSQMVIGDDANNMKGVVAPCKLDRNESNGHRVCRVCYLGLSGRLENGPPIELGCECKHDLAFAHHQCAETWFKIKGNRTCEICGSTVENVCGAGDPNFLEQWNDGDARAATVSEAEQCWQNHRIFNVLLACMVFAFVLPWLFHVSAFFR